MTQRPIPVGRSTIAIVIVAALVIGVTAAFNPVIPLVCLAVLVVAVAAMFDVSALVIALLLLHMLGQSLNLSWTAVSIAGFNIYPNDIATILLVGVVLLRGLRAGSVPGMPRDLVGRLVILFLGYGFLSMLRSIPIHGWAAVLGFRQQIVYAVLYFLVLDSMKDQRTRVRLAAAILIAAFGVALLGVYNVATNTPYGGRTGSHTLRYLSSFQAMTLFFGLSIVIGGIWAVRRPLWSLALAALCIFGVLASQARSVWLAGAAGLLVGSIGSRAWRRIALRFAIPALIVVVILLAAGGLQVGQYVTERAASLGSVQEDVTWVWRLFVWGEALHKLASSPVLGLGLGQPFTFFNIARDEWETDRQIHNSYIELAYYIGAIGLLIYIAIQGFVLWKTLSAARRMRGRPRGAVLGALASCQVCLYGVAFANVVGASMTATAYTWILSAISMLEVREAERELAEADIMPDSPPNRSS